MTRILLVRHGESEANRAHKFAGAKSDVPLLERGLQQAELTAQFVVEKYDISKVYTSNLQRAYITGKCVADRLGLDVTVREVLTEIDGGDWEGVSFSEMETNYPKEFALWTTDYGHSACPGGESVAQVAKRIMDAVMQIVEENPDKTVLIVSHGTPVRTMQGLAQNGTLDNLHRIPWASNASVTVLEYENGNWRCVAASLDAHLGELRTALPKTV